MPLTPRFVLSQSDEIITVSIRTPHVRVSASTLEVVIDDDTFHFYSPPYLLRLTFPGRLVDDAESGREARAVYDPSLDNGTVRVTVYKNSNDIGTWDGLDLVGRLMMTGRQHREDQRQDGEGRAAIEILSSTDHGSSDACGNDIPEIHNNETDVSTSQIPIPAPENSTSHLLNLTAPRYGFLQLYDSVFADLTREGLCYEMLELIDPDTTLEEDRRDMRLEVEVDKFDIDRYLGDALLGEILDLEHEEEGSDMIYDEAVGMVPHWMMQDAGEKEEQTNEISVENLTRDVESLSIDSGSHVTKLSTEEMDLLASVPASHIPPVDFGSMNKVQIRSTLLSILDILFAYAYDHRTTGGDPTVESSWTIAILSPTFSWFECYSAPANGTESTFSTTSTISDTPGEVFSWCIRRSIIYPYLRSYNLGVLIVNDVVAIMRGGVRRILRCLLQTRKIFEKSTSHYLLNKLYVDPLIFWIQTLQEGAISDFLTELDEVLTDMKSNRIMWKERIGLNLVRIEAIFKQSEEDEVESSNGESLNDDTDSSGSHDDSTSVSGSDDDDSLLEDQSDNDDLNDAKAEAEAKVSSELLKIGNDECAEADLDTSMKLHAAGNTKTPLIQEL